MPRKRDIPKKKIIPDPIYKSANVTRLTNMIMQMEKKEPLRRLFMMLYPFHQKKQKKNHLAVLEKALQ